MLNKTEVLDLAKRIKESVEWIYEDLELLCEIAGIEEEWKSSDGETFEAVAFKAAEKLGVEII